MRLRLGETLLYLGLRLKRALDRRPRPIDEIGTASITRILAISCTALGDTLLSTPALHALRKTYPNAHIALVVHPAFKPLFEGLADVDALIPYDGKWQGFWLTVRQCKKHAYDLAVIFHGNEPQATPLAYLSGARHIFKLPNTSRWSFLLSNQVPLVSWSDLGHGIEQRLAVAKLAGARGNFSRRMRVPRHASGMEAVDQAMAALGWQAYKIVALQPGASTNSRRWPRARFVELARQLAKEQPDLRFIVTGSPAEKLLCQEVASGIESAIPHATGRCAWSSAGELPLTALPALIERASVLVSGDTGPMHLAIAIGTPVVALFAVSDPARSGPAYDLDRHIVIRKWRTCDPCLSKQCPYSEPICMNNISVEEVRVAVSTVLQRQHHDR